MLCEECKNKPIAKGIKLIKCWCCLREVAINMAYNSHLCRECSEKRCECECCNKRIINEISDDQSYDAPIIPAEEALKMTNNRFNAVSKEELRKLNLAIQRMCMEGYKQLTLLTGLTVAEYKKQNEIFANFTGVLHQNTISKLRELGYSVIIENSYQGHNITISWE